jgi:hypothetical protein
MPSSRALRWQIREYKGHGSSASAEKRVIMHFVLQALIRGERLAELGEAGVAVSDAMRHEYRVQLVGRRGGAALRTGSGSKVGNASIRSSTTGIPPNRTIQVLSNFACDS